VPLKLVKSFGGNGNVDSGSVENAVCDFFFHFRCRSRWLRGYQDGWLFW
jgi:hypothetical protein